MKNIIVSVLFAFLGSFVHAGTIECSSKGEHIAENKIDFNVTLTTSWTNRVKSGVFTSMEPVNGEIIKGKFLCDEADENGDQECGVLGNQPNISMVFVHQVFGLTITVPNQKHIILFSCNKG